MIVRPSSSTLLIACALLLAACGGGDAAESQPPAPVYSGASGDFNRTVTVAGVSRSYLLHVPSSYRSGTPMPVVVLLHGGQGSGTSIGAITAPDGFSAHADRSGFIAVYPNAINGVWNDGRETITTGTDDVGFIAALLDALARDYNVDARRVYAAGISNGGMMSYRLACELSDRVAAIATVGANMPAALAAKCNPARAVPVAAFSGTADPLMPYGGGSIGGTLNLGTGGTALSVADSATFWATRNRLPPTPQLTALADTNPLDGTTTELIDYGGPAAAGQVVLYRINDGGHTWPGGLQYQSVALIGIVARDFSANEAIWSFFVRHPRP